MRVTSIPDLPQLARRSTPAIVRQGNSGTGTGREQAPSVLARHTDTLGGLTKLKLYGFIGCPDVRTPICQVERETRVVRR